MSRFALHRSWAVLAIVFLAGCTSARVLMPTPNLYAEVNAPLFRDLHAELSETQVELIYVTDRVSKKDESGRLHYGSGRSNSLSIGTTVVDLGQILLDEPGFGFQLVRTSLVDTYLFNLLAIALQIRSKFVQRGLR